MSFNICRITVYYEELCNSFNILSLASCGIIELFITASHKLACITLSYYIPFFVNGLLYVLPNYSASL
nr:MAG TPA: hypothetical protein [Crassvirales sp.]